MVRAGTGDDEMRNKGLETLLSLTANLPTWIAGAAVAYLVVTVARMVS
jgi:hypothetical protein